MHSSKRNNLVPLASLSLPLYVIPLFFPLARARVFSAVFITVSLPLLGCSPRHGAINMHKKIPTKYIKPVRRFCNQLARLNSEASRSSRRRLIFSTSIDESRPSYALISFSRHRRNTGIPLRDTVARSQRIAHVFRSSSDARPCQSRKRNDSDGFQIGRAHV